MVSAIPNIMQTNYLKHMVEGYLEAAAWTEQDELRYTNATWSAEAIKQATKECEEFLVCALPKDVDMVFASQMGHDFWLTRNGHGAGFWDRGLGEAGERLTLLCKNFGERYVYVAGDDNQLYFGLRKGRTMKTTKHAFDFLPSDVAEVLLKLAATLDPVELDKDGSTENYCDVRLQVTGNEEDGFLWAVRYGDSSYDLDGRGFWGHSCIDANLTPVDALDIATDLIDQADEGYAEFMACEECGLIEGNHEEDCHEGLYAKIEAYDGDEK